MISLEKLKILIPLQKLPKNVGDLGKLIVAPGFEKLPYMVTLIPSTVTNGQGDQIGRFIAVWATF